MLYIVLSQILKSCEQKLSKKRNNNKKFVTGLNFKGVEFPVYKKDYAKIEKENDISISCLVMKIKHHTALTLKNKLLKSMLIHYNYRVIKVFIIFLL